MLVQAKVQTFVSLFSWCCLLTSGQLTPEQQQLALNFHNELRASVVPTAANMRMLDWSAHLASLAQAAADKCLFEHNYGGDYAGLGENLYKGGADIKSAVMMWYTEGDNYNFATGSCSPGRYPKYSTCGHWSQVVKASVSRVGCGLRSCSGSNLIVCEYNTGEAQPPYATGKACSQCPYFAYYCYRGLCLTGAQRVALTNPSAATCQPNCNECQYVFHIEGTLCKCNNNASCTASVCSAAGTPCIQGSDASSTGGACVCTCTTGYSGSQCQFDNNQLDNGIQLRFAGGVRSCSYYPTPTYLWQSSLESAVFSAIAGILNRFCSGQDPGSFGNSTAEEIAALCCPDTLTTNSTPPGVEFIGAGDIQLMAADSGYYPLQEVTGEARVVLYARRRPTDAFCGRVTDSVSSQYLSLASFESILRLGNASLAQNGSGPIGCCGYYATVITAPRNDTVQWPTYCLGSSGGGGGGGSGSSSNSANSANDNSGSGSGQLSGVALEAAIACGVVGSAALLIVLGLVVGLVIVPKIRGTASSVSPLLNKKPATNEPRPPTPPPEFGADNSKQQLADAGVVEASSVDQQQANVFNAPGPLMGMPFIPDTNNDPLPSFLWRPAV